MLVYCIKKRVFMQFFLTTLYKRLKCERVYFFMSLFMQKYPRSLLVTVLSLAIISPAFASVGEYKEVSCDSDPVFSSNSCNQCFDGGSVGAGEKISGLYDNWTNANPGEQIIYKDEQTFPQLINVGGENTSWVQNPNSPDAFWRFADEVLWTKSSSGALNAPTADSGSTSSGTTDSDAVSASGGTDTLDTASPSTADRDEFMLEANKTIRFLDSEMASFIALDKTDKAAGQKIGVLAFDINYHALDTDGKEQPRMGHRECVAFSAKGSVTPQQPAPEPKKMTSVKTGPESTILVILALALTLGVYRARRKVS